MTMTSTYSKSFHHLVLLITASLSLHVFGATGVRFDEGYVIREGHEVRIHDRRVDGSRRVLADGGNSNNTRERDILVEVRKGVTSDPHGALSSWSPSIHANFCSWAGVGCDSSGHVSALNLSKKGLAGVLSTSVGQLSFLTSLDLTFNSFNGAVPRSLGLLQRLQRLDLSNNTFTEGIPTEISNCSSLMSLKLSSNNLSGSIPSELEKLRNISEVELAYNQLTHSIPASIGNCSSLTYLDLSFNQLVGTIPRDLGNLAKLSTLSLFNNKLTGAIPLSITNCTSLRSLDVSSNLLQGDIPPQLSVLRHLTMLRLNSNNMSGPIPSSLGNISTLTDLRLGGVDSAHAQKHTGRIPPELGKLRNLKKFFLRQTNITGTIPPEFGQLSSLTEINVKQNPLTGNIPVAIKNLSSLVILKISENQFSGPVPSWFGDGSLPNIQGIGIRYNHLTGTLPPDLGNLTKIFRLLFSFNSLSGPVIPQLGQLTSILELGLDNNFFTGELPAALGNCTGFTQVFFQNNSLTGSIPKEMLTSCTSLYNLTANNNQFSGPIPPEIGQLVNLEWLDLSSNQFSGPIPSTIGNCKAFMGLRLSNNNLTGQLPIAALEQLAMLQVFEVANNSLEGPVPPTVGAFVNVTSADYAGNPGLCGAILRRNCSNSNVPSSKTSCRDITCHNRWWAYVIIAPAASLLLVVAVFLGICYGRRRKFERKENKVSVDPQTDSDLPNICLYTKEIQLTVEDLWMATDGFSDAKILGAGGFSTVYKTVIPKSGMVIATKCLNLDPRRQIIVGNDLHHEMRVCGKLRHKNLVKVFGFCSTATFKALLLEFVPNGSLHEHLYPNKEIQSRPLDWRSRLRIAIDVADALVYLHHEGHHTIIHRDLKPSNILLDADFSAKVSDFGIAKYVSQGSKDEATVTNLVGTTGYIPPEYATTLRASTKGDVYSFGVILLELLTGRRPTDNDFGKHETLVNWVVNALPDQISDVLDDTLRHEFAAYENQIQLFSRVARLCTHDGPKDRPTMREVREMLMRVKNPSLPKQGSSGRPDLEELIQKA